MEKKKLVVLSGAGISAESGLKTFREMNGLWESYSIHEVATPEAWVNDKELVLRFYNERRRQLKDVEPNAGHYGLAELESHFNVHIITQNVDNLHERAGSTNVLHLHGELTKARSTSDSCRIYDIGYKDILDGDKCGLGSQLRPHIVWFGEMVPEIEDAAKIVSAADIFVVIGTSLEVYPAAGLLAYAPPGIPVYVIDPGKPDLQGYSNLQHIQQPATTGIQVLREILQQV